MAFRLAMGRLWQALTHTVPMESLSGSVGSGRN